MNIINTSLEKFERWLEAAHRRDLALTAHATAQVSVKKILADADARLIEAKADEQKHWAEVQALRAP